MSKQFDLLSKFYTNRATGNELMQLGSMLDQVEIWDVEFDDVWNHVFGEIPETVDNRIRKRLDEVSNPQWGYPLKRILTLLSHVAAVVLIGVVGFFWQENRILTRYDNQVVEVGRGQKSEVCLPDGTKVYLNADSRLCYGREFNGRGRHVELSGEAYFEVAKDASSPFVVTARGVKIKAVGTSFNVQAYPHSSDVTTYLSEGSVLVCSESHSTLLKPGEVAVYTVANLKIHKKNAREGRFYTGWINDELNFDEKSLPQIIDLLERHYNVKFAIKDDKLSKITFSGTLKNNSLQSTLDALQFTAPIVYKHNEDVIELYSK